MSDFRQNETVKEWTPAERIRVLQQMYRWSCKTCGRCEKFLARRSKNGSSKIA